MDTIMIAESPIGKDALVDMLNAAEEGMGGLLTGGRWAKTDIPTALLVIEIAKRAEDRAEWFPRGKWATIQAIQARCEMELETLFNE